MPGKRVLSESRLKWEPDLVERSKIYHYLPKHVMTDGVLSTQAEAEVWNKAIDEMISAIQKVPSAQVDIETLTKTRFKVNYPGSVITYAICERCKRSFTYPTDDPFNCCPYCIARRE